jgi:two-component sensor histidine kinase
MDRQLVVDDLMDGGSRTQTAGVAVPKFPDAGSEGPAQTGLGTGIVKALAQELNASVETVAGPDGTIVSITHTTFAARATRAA